VVFAHAFWEDVRAVFDRWHDWRLEREFRRRHTEIGRSR
jgi:hypothetical protein